MTFSFRFVIGPFYNQPKFSPCATWNPDAITFANNNTVGTHPYTGLFITTNNTVYIAESSFNRVQIWIEGSTIPTKNISGGLKYPYSIFVTDNGDIYVDNGGYNHRVDKWTENTTNSSVAMYINGSCFSLFVDINGNLYCSLGDLQQVIKKSFNDDRNTSSIVAGNGSAGSESYMLNTPRGIFVDFKLNLYVADCNNNRIQFFPLGQRNGTTIVGNGLNETITLDCPIGITLDADGYIFIADSENSRIIGSGPDGFRCIVGCFGTGSAANQLNHSRIISFDSYGDLFVVDAYNDRVQKFLLAANFCSKYDQRLFHRKCPW
jgi:hypothetical protein